MHLCRSIAFGAFLSVQVFAQASELEDWVEEDPTQPAQPADQTYAEPASQPYVEPAAQQYVEPAPAYVEPDSQQYAAPAPAY